MNTDYIEKVHIEILSVMDAVKKVCEDNDIRYYLVGGTLLGAIRHNGFIPWDDDLDIAMPRNDFDKFIKICDSEIEPPYKLLWTSTMQRYWYPFAKVHKEGTLFIESTYKDISEKTGIYIDIFPLDEVSGLTKDVERRKRTTSYITMFMQNLVLDKHGSGIKSRVKWIVENAKNVNEWNMLQERIMSKDNGKGYTYYANFGSYYSIKKQTMPMDYYGSGVLVDFEGRKYNAPKMYHEVLTSIYGPSYMELPPIDKRMTHYPSEVLFSDGTRLEFDVDENKKVHKE